MYIIRLLRIQNIHRYLYRSHIWSVFLKFCIYTFFAKIEFVGDKRLRFCWVDFFLRFSSKLLTALGLKWSSRGIDSTVRTPILSFFFKTDLRPACTFEWNGGGGVAVTRNSEVSASRKALLYNTLLIIYDFSWSQLARKNLDSKFLFWISLLSTFPFRAGYKA